MNRAGYSQSALVGGLLMFASTMSSCLGTHKFIASLLHEPKRAQSWAERWRELSGTLTNRSFLALIASGVFGAISLGLSGMLELYVGNYYWELTPAQMSYFPMLSTLSAFVGVVLAPGISRRFGKKPSMISLFVCSTFTASGPVALRLLGLMPANHTSTLLTILLTSYFLTAALGLTGLIIISSMMADVVEDVAVVTGQRSEGLLFAANGLLNKRINGVGVFLSGLLLAVVHFPQHAVQGQVAPAILRNLALIYAPAIASCSLISIALLLFYDIDRSIHERNLERLEDVGIERVAKKAASVL